jgi:hypothetical protein
MSSVFSVFHLQAHMLVMEFGWAEIAAESLLAVKERITMDSTLLLSVLKG